MKKNRKKIAIVGAGIFGCTLAIMLNKKFNVSIFEKQDDITEKIYGNWLKMLKKV